jgi:ribonuclease Z
MGSITVLGSGFAVPDDVQDNTHLAIQQGERTILVDAASNPIQRLRRANIVFDDLTDIILTHFHPDHVSGIPLLLMGMWLLGRRQGIDIYGLEHTLTRMKTVIELYELEKWPNFYPIIFHTIPDKELSLVLETDELRILASPVKHLIPTIGLRIEFIPQKKVVAYSCDTEPCEQVVRLADRADMLFHEATGEGVGHTSAAQAAVIATKAQARHLYLIHYSASKHSPESLVEEAKQYFAGSIHATQDFMTFQLD